MTKKTRILNISPKAQLAITDSNLSIYPTILRTGDERTLGNNSSRFDDSKTQRYTQQEVLMPFNTSKDWVEASGFLTGTLTLNKAPTAASQFLTRYVDENYVPYNESRNPAGFFQSGSTQNAGFDETLYQGFESPISSKIAIPIDISINSDVTVGIIGDPKDPKTTSPFVYYNFESKTWDQIGTSDPSTGKSYNYYHLMDTTLVTIGPDTWADGQENHYPLVKQFTSSPGIAHSLGPAEANLRSHGYDKIGYPTSFFDAPNGLRYHAKSSQTIKLSNFITSPFILEKIQVKAPVTGERYHNGPVAGGGIPLPQASGSTRDIDNHVFFIYRQNRCTQFTDTAQDVSSSIRALIGNESFTFYNRPSMLFNGISYSRPTHETGFLGNYNVPLNAVGTFTLGPVSLDMTFTPKTYEQQYTAPSTIGINISAGNSFTNGYIQNYWDGGQRSVENETDVIRSIPTLSEAIRTIQIRDYNFPLITATSNPAYPIKNHRIDPRTLRSSSTISSFRESIGPVVTRYFDYDVASKNIGYRKNLYVLFPEDELIFGIDAGMFPTYVKSTSITGPPGLPPGYYDEIADVKEAGNSSLDTTSRLIIHRGEAQVILYGTMIREGRELLGSLNQQMTSPAIHEDIHEIITDQFQTNETALYSGSYISQKFDGSMSVSPPTRKVSSTLDGTMSRLSSHINFSNVVLNSKIDLNSLSYPPPIFGDPTKLTPKYLTAKFRYDKFGQVRDMLEQRLDTKGIETIFASKNFSIPDFVKTFGTQEGTSPVIVNFVSQSSTDNVNPVDTRSGNLSFECTSSLPYFDEIARNRPTIVFNNNPPFEVQTIILNKGSSLLTTT